MKKIIYLGSDHGGFELKQNIKKYFDTLDLKYQDLGNTVLDNKDDYPDFAIKVGKKVAQAKSLGLVICRSGIGASIAANKVKGVYAANIDSVKLAQLSKEHNNVNVLCLGADFVDMVKVKKIIKVWLDTPFAKGRHARRINKIKKIDK